MFCKHKWKVLDKEVIPSPMSTREIRDAVLEGLRLAEVIARDSATSNEVEAVKQPLTGDKSEPADITCEECSSPGALAIGTRCQDCVDMSNFSR